MVLVCVCVCVRWFLHETLWRFIVSVALKSLNRIHEIILCITFCKSKPHNCKNELKLYWKWLRFVFWAKCVKQQKKNQFNFRQAHFLVDRLYYFRSFLFTHETIYWFQCVALYCECVFFFVASLFVLDSSRCFTVICVYIVKIFIL